ncbi:hypothetical protein C8J57DRAFT_1229728 [Mycena rebaudengoi]|nr:hypothetical protein C8J57DRAFT_1229728 [Mycena rebaudengoi]
MKHSKGQKYVAASVAEELHTWQCHGRKLVCGVDAEMMRRDAAVCGGTREFQQPVVYIALARQKAKKTDGRRNAVFTALTGAVTLQLHVVPSRRAVGLANFWGKRHGTEATNEGQE